MHSGTVARGDSWLRDNIKSYADWAQTHNSLLIVTWDEDEFSSPTATASRRSSMARWSGNRSRRPRGPCTTCSAHRGHVTALRTRQRCGRAAIVGHLRDPEVITTNGVDLESLRTQTSHPVPRTNSAAIPILSPSPALSGLLRFILSLAMALGRLPLAPHPLRQADRHRVDNAGKSPAPHAQD